MILSQHFRRAKVRAEAAAWVARLHGGGRNAELERAFRVWLNEDEEHANVFERLTDIWQLLSQVPAESLPRGPASHVPERRMRMGIVLALSLCAGALGLAIWIHQVDPHYSTEKGEQRFINLEDGTRVSLNSNTRLQVEFRKHARNVALERGEAFFEVARDASRPFKVIAGENTVVAVGTAFAVRVEPTTTTVTLVEGKVNVLREGSPAELGESLVSRTLNPGEDVTLRVGHETQVGKPAISKVLAWRHGEVLLDNTTLADAAEEFYRYDKTKLVIDDPQVAAQRVSGVYRTGDTIGFATAVASMYGLTVSQEGDSLHLRRRDEKG